MKINTFSGTYIAARNTDEDPKQQIRQITGASWHKTTAKTPPKERALFASWYEQTISEFRHVLIHEPIDGSILSIHSLAAPIALQYSLSYSTCLTSIG